ncbi:MAG TPA: DEAD/DEAH box helicase [Thiobacillaceae bacterium]|nr:DEAD/DEAH box helicase [Thiobacillaceae bacterium]
MNFSELGLDPLILKSVIAAGYENATPVQQQAIPAALTGRDLLVSSHTGSGKTAAFLLPSIQRLQAEPAVKSIGPRVLVLTPTRELALQVEKSAMAYGKELRRFRTACLVGGAPYGLQLKRLSQPVDVVVATPGRLIDHLERGKIDFSRLEVLILDEADRMLDMGFIDDIRAIAARCPADRQTLLFSATLDGVVGSLARELTTDAERIEIEAAPQKEAMIEQRLLFADNMEHKNRLLDALLRDVEMVQAIVFASTKRSAEEISDLLADSGFASDALHGDMQQGQRNRALQRLREGRTRVLVATDVAARGIDVATISHVINFDLPRQAEDYVHRIGRTGRAGRAGIAVSFAGMREGGLVKNIERYIGNRIQVHTLPGLEPTQRPVSGRPANRGFGDKRRTERAGPRSYGDRPPRGEGRDNRDRAYRGSSAASGRPMRDGGPRSYDERPYRTDDAHGGGFRSEPQREVNGNSIEYWEKREREAKAKAAAARSYGDRAGNARGGQARGYSNDNRGGGRAGVRGRFKG